MKIPALSSLRARMFVVLVLVSVIPAVLTLIAGTLILREVVLSTGSAGAWDEVAASGRALFDQIEVQGSLSSDLIAAMERHQDALAESVRFSRVYAFIAERVLFLLPVFALALLGFLGGLALLAANWLSRSFSRPVEELVRWTKFLASGTPLPAALPSGKNTEVAEFAELKNAFRATAEELGHARQREIEQARMRTWSEMARRIAHDLKNPLTPMAMAADRVARSSDTSVSAAGEVLKEEIGRLDELARAFAHFGRPPEGPMSSVDLSEMLLSLSRRLEAEGSHIRLSLPEGQIFVMGHLEALERVVRNLLSNAHDSMEARAAQANTPYPNGDPDSDQIEISLLRSGDWVEIRVGDRGAGIPEDVLSRIWEPEFTTRRKGTGLGLAMVRQVVLAHAGEVEAWNRDGGGADFVIRLPTS